MARRPSFIVQSYQRRAGELALGDAYSAESEADIFKRGRAMADRVDGMVFFKIETSGDGDVWTEVELLARVGDVPAEAA